MVISQAASLDLFAFSQDDFSLGELVASERLGIFCLVCCDRPIHADDSMFDAGGCAWLLSKPLPRERALLALSLQPLAACQNS